MEFTRQVIDANTDLIYIKNHQGTIILANTAFAHIHHLDLSALLESGKLENDYSYDRDLEVLESNQPISFEELYKINRDNKKWYHTTKKAFTSEDGSRYLISMSSDITSYKTYTQIADSLIKAQEFFLSSIRSELQASAMAIAGMGKLMRNSFLTKEQETYLNSIVSIADHLVEAPSISLLQTGLETEKFKAKTPVGKEALPEKVNTSNKLESIRVLLVENDAASIFLTSSLLKSWGVALNVAHSGEQALKQVYEKEYDLIFLDIQMHGMDGFECANQIKHTPNPNQATPIVAFTANKTTFDMKSYRLAGFADYLYKPYDEADLYRMISRNAVRELKVQQPSVLYQPWKNHALYDFSGLGSLVEDPVFIRKMQLLFINTVPQQLTSLTDAIQAQNWYAAVHISHRLKSIFANIKVVEAAAALNVIEENASKELNLDENYSLLQVLHEVSATIVADFSSQLQADA